MESNSWSDSNSEDKNKDVPPKKGDALAPPSNFVFGPGTSAVFGSSETVHVRDERPLFAPRSERSEPETVRAITPAEVAMPPVVEAPEPVQISPEQPRAAYYPAQEINPAAQEDDDEDDEEKEDDDDTPAKPLPPPPHVKAEPLPSISIGEHSKTGVLDVPVAAPVEATGFPDIPVSEQPRQAEYVPPSAPPPESAPSKPYPPQEVVLAQPDKAEDANSFIWPAAGDKMPPPPEIPKEFAELEPVSYQPQPPESPAYSSSASSPSSGPQFNTNYYALRHNTYHDPRLKMIGLYATTVLVGWWVNHQSKKRDKALAKQVSQEQQVAQTREDRQEEFRTRSSKEQADFRINTEAQRRYDQMHPNTLPPIQKRPEVAPIPPGVPYVEQIFGDQPEQSMELQPEDQLKHSAWHSYVERDGRVIEDAITYGEAYQQERLRERMPTPFGTKDARFTAGATANYQQGAGNVSEPRLPSGQVPQNYSLPSGQAQQDPQHLLSPPEPNPVVATLASPWLWLGVGVLMIAFFLAATI